MTPYEPRPEGLNTDPAPPSVVGTLKPLRRCAASRDGECWHTDCPQIRDNEPKATGRHCPLDTGEEND
ncbi:hypothetical protein EIL82_22015 [Pandoraea apista]|uniref:hypothetical protein n=1 Tax=Pandoraea apista TaxID=93218 RepID=UPI000F620731|nr:hypothetical protein [Pandoraea apista]RRJ73161.1 hypothetical protein EIL82_22015 [Pandoraea apista]